MKTEQVLLTSLRPHPKNYNRHSKDQVRRLAESLKRFGQPKPIVVWQHYIIAGHGLVEGAKQAKFETLLAADMTDDWTETQAIAFLAADNELARMGDPDEEALKLLLQELSKDDVELAALAAGTEEKLAEILDVKGDMEDVEPQIDKADELQKKWGTATGQLWQLGEHRLVCGDCRDPETWARLLDGVKANGVFTSPPYAEQRKEQYGGTPADEYVDWWEAVQANVKANLAQDGSFFVNIKPHCEDGERVLYVFDLVLAMRRQWGWRYEEEFCWKHGGTPKRVQRKFKNAFEPIYHFAIDYAFKFRPNEVTHKSSAVPVWDVARGLMGARKASNEQGKGNGIYSGVETEGEAYPPNVIEAGFSDKAGHAAAFPVSLPDFFVRAYSDTGDLWLDPFCGSGTTIVAAHNNNRRGYGIEMLPKYVAVILERLSTMTGKTPVLVP
jgi:DNA modification methylase